MAAMTADLDRRVQALLEQRQGTWKDLNVPDADGRTLHQLVLDGGYTRALEIGTSTGHSGVWIAWALSKTGGRLTTIDADRERQRTAIENFEEAGVSSLIDVRLGDAHRIAEQLEGPYDFIFSDADKEWYSNYLHTLWPKLTPGGCFAAHNVSMDRPEMKEFLAALERLPDGQTTIDRSSDAGLSITYKGSRS
jgi:predicted O-methyltransferase YrrM